jgi:1-aminocyclopropane-1-carboxylate deaminase/D-cysteine desulfhydrase-like pyridoxal-dependent ACC family enzyme
MYINAHAEELRSQFVAHKDKKKLVVPISGKIGNLGFEEFAQNMVEEMQKNILDENLKDRVIPDFSTTTTTDKVVASVAFWAL